MSGFVQPDVQISNIFSLQRYKIRRAGGESEFRLRLISWVNVSSVPTSSNCFFSPKTQRQREAADRRVLSVTETINRLSKHLQILINLWIHFNGCSSNLTSLSIQVSVVAFHLHDWKQMKLLFTTWWGLFPSSVDHITLEELLPNQNIIPAHIVVCWTWWRTLWTVLHVFLANTHQLFVSNLTLVFCKATWMFGGSAETYDNA